ncbi:MAG: LysM domain-containing protein [Patescibacteria group bacterium]
MKKLMICLAMAVMIFGTFSVVLAETGIEEKTYTVKKGDTPSDIFFMLWVISKAAPKKILEWNPGMGLHNIYPGQKIKYYLEPDKESEVTQEIKGNLERINLSITQLEEKISQLGATKALEDLVSSSREENQMNIKSLRKEFEEKLDSRIDSGFSFLGQKFSRLFWLTGVGFLIVVLLLGYIILAGRRPIKLKEKVKIEIGDKVYDYYPAIDKEGRYISLYKNKAGNYLKFCEIGDLYKSVKASLKKNPDLIEQEIRAGRLIQRK